VNAQAKIDAQKRGVRYGCHADLFDGEEPDDCVIGTMNHADCVFASRHDRREECRYWQPVTAKGVDP
jgi:hypothetical protein